jgi:hypothetical protein
VSAVTPITAFADDGTTSTPTPTEVSGGGGDAGSDQDVPAGDPAAPTETPAPEESVPATETPAPEEGAPATETPVIEQLPEDTTVVVVNSEGETEPLATQDAAEAIATGNPIWCPDGQTPTPGENGCTQEFSSFDELLTFLKENETDSAYQQAGTIYVGMGDYAGGETDIDFNQHNFQNLNNYNLTIQGGWDVVNNAADPVNTTSLGASLTIGSSSNPWIGSLTLNSILIQNTDSGLAAYSQNDVSLNNVSVTGVDGTGATLSSTNGNVTVTGGEFDGNDVGADLSAGGSVTIQGGASFDNNKKAGAVVNAGGNVYVSDATFNGNGSVSKSKVVDGRGLDVTSGSYVSLYNVQANENKLYGSNINATGSVSINNSFFSGNQSSVCACGSTTYYGYGLKVVSLDGVFLYGVEASDNNLFGASLDGSMVVVTDGTFNSNGSAAKKIDGKGLEIKSGGIVSLSNVQANENRQYGADINATGGVSVSNSFFNGNQGYASTSGSCSSSKTYYGYGLQVVTLDSISLNNVTANNNYLFGAHLEAGGGVNISSGFFDNNGVKSSSKVDGRGLEIKSGGFVSLNSVEANNNYVSGATIDSASGVSISNGFFSGNQSYTGSCSTTYYGYGLRITSKDSISLYGVTANDNNLYGAYLNAVNGVSVVTSAFSSNGSASTKSIDGKGLEIVSSNYVSLYDVQANDNRQFGADINASGYVSITNGVFSGNQAVTCGCNGTTYYGYGLKVVTLSGISLSQVTANDNNLYGANLDAVQDVSVTDSTFTSNGVDGKNIGYGLDIASEGNVSLTNVQANDNKQYGANITAGGNVNINNSYFSGNQSYSGTSCGGKTYYGYGLQVVSVGGISLSGVTADNNNLFGAHLDSDADVSIYGSSFSSNGANISSSTQGNGLEIISGGSVNLISVTASQNNLNGATIEPTGNVYVTESTFNSNKKGSGLSISKTSSDVYLTSVTAMYNGVDGVYVKGICTNNLFINGGTFSNNKKYGVEAWNIVVTQSNSPVFSGNTSGGLYVNNSACSGGSGSGSGCGGGSGSGGSHHGCGGCHHSYYKAY